MNLASYSNSNNNNNYYCYCIKSKIFTFSFSPSFLSLLLLLIIIIQQLQITTINASPTTASGTKSSSASSSSTTLKENYKDDSVIPDSRLWFKLDECYNKTGINLNNNITKMDQNKSINMMINEKHLLSSATVELAWKMMQIIDSNDNEKLSNELTAVDNVVMSPFSIQMLLNLLLMGSSGENRQELLNILNYSKIQQKCSSSLSLQKSTPDGANLDNEFNPHEIMNLIQNEIKQQIEQTNSIQTLWEIDNDSDDNSDGDGDNDDHVKYSNIDDDDDDDNDDDDDDDDIGYNKNKKKENKKNNKDNKDNRDNKDDKEKEKEKKEKKKKRDERRRADFQVANLLLTNYAKFGKMPDNLNENFLKNLQKFYQNVKIDSFNGGSLSSSSGKELIDSINQWVNLNTKGKIDKLFESEEDLGSDIELLMIIMANCVYFKSRWLKTFDDFKTKEKIFHSNHNNNDNKQKMHKFMTNLASYDYLELSAHQQKQILLSGDEQNQQNYNKIDKNLIDLNCQILGIPFKTTNLSMIFILPKLSTSSSLLNKNDNKLALEKLQQKLNGKILMKIFSLLDQNQDVRVKVEIPKFKFERQLDVRDLLQNKLKLGKRIFQYHPNGFGNLLPKNSSTNQLSIGVDQLIHKSMIEIDENGVEAAAVTLLSATLKSIIWDSVEPPEFIADHPFLFFILHTPTRMPLFMGRVTKL